MKLTGRTRIRVDKPWFGKACIVLQVEETGLTSDYDCGYVHTYNTTRWRDARVEDLDADNMELRKE